MTRAIRIAYVAELVAAHAAGVRGDINTAFGHLERAHILSQSDTFKHVHVHWLMLKFGVSAGAWHEVVGQMSRICAAALFSRIWVPVGNTGRANVSALKPMPIPDDLRTLLEND